MVVVRFSVFEEKVRSGKKKQTIRPAETYRHLKVGDKIQCYSTKKVPGSWRPIVDELLYEGVVTEIQVDTWGEIRDKFDVAWLDGFDDEEEMKQWFEKKYGKIPEDRNFRIIRWK